MGWPAVQGLVDGDPAVAETFNQPINQLAERTEYLRRLLGDNDRTKVVITATADSSITHAGQVAYRKEDGVYAAASANVGQNEWFYADQSAMAIGVVSAISGSTATIVIYGLLEFTASVATGIACETLIDDANPTSGRFFLSTTTGKLTAAPVGPIIYVCDCNIADGYVKSMLVSPQYRDTGESHIHRSFVISGKPMGGYCYKYGGRYGCANIQPDRLTSDPAINTTSASSKPALIIEGAWLTDKDVTYTFAVTRNSGASEQAAKWSNYTLNWESHGVDGAGSFSFDDERYQTFVIGSHGLVVKMFKPYINTGDSVPASVVGRTYTVSMPDAGRAWVDYSDSDGTPLGFRFNLGMHPVLARFVPPLPANGAALTVDGVELRSEIFDDTNKTQWRIMPADADGGPWLIWYGGSVNEVSATAPFIWAGTVANQRWRDIVLHVNRMRVGPTGFVTSLQVAKDSPLKITSAQTDAEAYQGALQIGLDIDFTTRDTGVEGYKVIKSITGTKFETGPVVERIVAGPGLSVDRGQGTVTVSASNASYAGDFETIALKNAKQDLAGGVFPYTKLLGWSSYGTNIASGFTAKFRVPDHIPYGEYNVIVSASIFGEDDGDNYTANVATFNLTCYMLADYAVTSSKQPVITDVGSIANPVVGRSGTIPVSFASGYTKFDPVVVHGFSDIVTTDTAQMQPVSDLLLRAADGVTPIVVKPGYFVGISIARTGLSGSSTPYEGPIGFLSLRWNLVATGS